MDFRICTQTHIDTRTSPRCDPCLAHKLFTIVDGAKKHN